MPQAALIWLALLLLVLLGLFLLTVRRMSVLIGRTRDLERFQSAVAALDAGLAAVVDPLVAQPRRDPAARRRPDRPRRRARRDARRACATSPPRAASCARPRRSSDEAAALVVELDRAARAADMVEHGLDALLAHRGRRELEAQTSLKRGALNLRNARGAATRIAARSPRSGRADLLARPDGQARAAPVRAPSTYGPDGRRRRRRGVDTPACSGILVAHH